MTFLAVDLRSALLILAAQSADLLTFSAAHELNPVVRALGSWAVVAKLGLIAGLVLVAWTIGRPWSRRITGLAVAAGLLGAVSNLAA